MSDRVCVHIMCREQDSSVFEDMGFRRLSEEEISTEIGVCAMVDDQASGAHFLEFEKMKKIPFFGSHEAGIEFDACVFAHDGEGFAWASKSSDVPFGSFPIARIAENGEPDLDDLGSAREYWETLRKAKMAMGLAF